MQLTDIGANLAHDSFDPDREAVIQRAHSAGVTQMVITGSDAASTAAGAQLAQSYPGKLFATAGVHPHHATDCSTDVLVGFKTLATHGQIVAIGECGLDFFRDFSPRDVQERVLHAHLELAADLQLPVFLHQRDAHDRFLPILAEYQHALPAAVVHCFTGSASELHAYLDMDLHVGMTGWICDERRGRHLLDCVGSIPDNRLMIETDAPYLTPRTIRPRPRTRRNEPANLPYVLNTVAGARQQSVDAVARNTTATARRFFNLPRPAVGQQVAGT